MAQTVLYKVYNNLYINLTNKCPCACTFCIRALKNSMDDSGELWLEHEPDAEEVMEALRQKDLSQYDEIVFCGFGEPTERLEVLVEVGKYLKANCQNSVRLNTNGLGDLIHGRAIAKELEGVIDVVSISLNTPNKQKYHEIVRSKFGDASFDAMLSFAKEAKKYVKHVILSTVETTISKEEEKECQAICDELGVTYKIRPFED